MVLSPFFLLLSSHKHCISGDFYIEHTAMPTLSGVFLSFGLFARA